MSPRRLDPAVVEARLRTMSELLDDLAGVADGVLVHEYVDIDLAQVRAAVPHALDGYRRYVRQVAAFVANLPH